MNRWKKFLDLDDEEIIKSGKANHYEVSKNDLLNSDELRREIQKNRRSFRLCLQPFLLPPLSRKKDFIPLLKFACDLSDSSCKLSLRVVMCRWVEVKTNGKKKKQLSGLGLRLETGDAAHNYCHAQFLSLPGCPHKMPEEDPCIPTAAASPVSLFFCMIVSFYGLKTWSKYFSTIPLDERHKKAIRQFFH